MQPAPAPPAVPNVLWRQVLAQPWAVLGLSSCRSLAPALFRLLPLATLPVMREPLPDPAYRVIPLTPLPVAVSLLIRAFGVFTPKAMPSPPLLSLATLLTTSQPGQACMSTPVSLPVAVTPLRRRPEALVTLMPEDGKPVMVPPSMLTPVRKCEGLPNTPMPEKPKPKPEPVMVWPFRTRRTLSARTVMAAVWGMGKGEGLLQ